MYWYMYIHMYMCVYVHLYYMWLPRWLSGKESTCQCKDTVHGYDSWVGRSPGGEHGNPPQYSCLENPMERGAWQAIVQRVIESDMTEWLSTHIHIYTIFYVFSLFKILKNSLFMYSLSTHLLYQGITMVTSYLITVWSG